MDDFPIISMAIFSMANSGLAQRLPIVAGPVRVNRVFFRRFRGGCNQQSGDEMGDSRRYNNLMGNEEFCGDTLGIPCGYTGKYWI